MEKADMEKARLMEKCFGFGDMWDEKNVKKFEIPTGDQSGKGSIKDEVIQEQHPVGPQADRERGQGNEALGIFTAICIGIGLAFLGL
uniref:Uncharacterized protein n=1 Tax=Acrobeloides nanus TaxID=290746 RepID=A0A914CHH1_9BILA